MAYLKAHWLSKEPADHEIVLTYNAPFVSHFTPITMKEIPTFFPPLMPEM